MSWFRPWAFGLLVSPLLLVPSVTHPPRFPAPADTGSNGLPLQPARWARFTATKGTWISLDVSPDGQRIAFDLLGDLYTLPIGGGTATRLTGGLAHDMQPRWSPDGKQIVFVSDRSGDENVWLVSASGGEPRPLTTGDDMVYHLARTGPRTGITSWCRRSPHQSREALALSHQGGPGPGAHRGASCGPDDRARAGP